MPQINSIPGLSGLVIDSVKRTQATDVRARPGERAAYLWERSPIYA